MARHVLGHLEVSELLLANARVDVDAAHTHVTEVLLQRVQRLLRALERRDNGRDGAVAAEQPAEAVAGGSCLLATPGRQLAQVVGLAVGVVLLQNCGALEVVLRLAVPDEDDLGAAPPPRQLLHPILQPAEEDAARPLTKEERNRRAGQAGAREQLGGASRHRGIASAGVRRGCPS